MTETKSAEFPDEQKPRHRFNISNALDCVENLIKTTTEEDSIVEVPEGCICRLWSLDTIKGALLNAKRDLSPSTVIPQDKGDARPEITDEDYDAISQSAYDSFRKYSRQPGLRGQTITPLDSIDYWMIGATLKHYHEKQATPPPEAQNAEGSLPCVSCGKPPNTSTPDDADMCWECFGGFNATEYGLLRGRFTDLLKRDYPDCNIEDALDYLRPLPEAQNAKHCEKCGSKIVPSCFCTHTPDEAQNGAADLEELKKYYWDAIAENYGDDSTHSAIISDVLTDLVSRGLLSPSNKTAAPVSQAGDEFYNATTEQALSIIESAFKNLRERGVESNYGITAAAIKQIRLNGQCTPDDKSSDTAEELMTPKEYVDRAWNDYSFSQRIDLTKAIEAYLKLQSAALKRQVG